MKAGDILLSWKTAHDHGDIESPFDLTRIFLGQVGQAPVSIYGQRKQQKFLWRLDSDSWGISVQPRLAELLLSKLQNCERQLTTGQVESGTAQLRKILDQVDTTHPWLKEWLLAYLADAADQAQQWTLADSLYQEAIDHVANLPVKDDLLRQWANSFVRRNDTESAQRLYRKILLDLQENGLATLFNANILLKLAILELQVSDYADAEKNLDRALKIGEHLSPKGLQTALTIMNLGIVYQEEGDLAKAEQYYLSAVEKEAAYFPRSIHLERALTNLGILFDQEGDFARAEPYHRRALKLARTWGVQTADVADVLSNLSHCLAEQRRFQEALALQKKSLFIRKMIGADALVVADSILGLGKIARSTNRLAKAREYYQQALSMIQKVTSSERDQASALMGLAIVQKQMKVFDSAESLFRQALAIIEKQDPNSVDRGTILAELAGTKYLVGLQQEAAALYQSAFEQFDYGILHLNGISESRSRFRAERIRYRQEYAELLLDMGNVKGAFEVIEGTRARTLVEMMAHGHSISNKNDIALLKRKEDLHHLITAKAEHRLQLFGTESNAPEIAKAGREIDELLLSYKELESQATGLDRNKFSSPETLTLTEIQHLLGPDTLLLEYTLGIGKSYAWVISDSSLTVYQIPSKSRIQSDVRALYEFFTLQYPNRGPAAGNADVVDFGLVARRLSQTLLATIKEIRPGKRLVIVAEGPLQYLPFAALPVPNRKEPTPLIAEHEIVYLPSASTLPQLRSQETYRKRPAKSVAIFADPVFNPLDDRVEQHSTKLFEKSAGLVVNSSQTTPMQTRSAFGLSRLIYTRNEAQAVLQASRTSNTLLALDFAANRKLALSSKLANYNVIHFATHGILDNAHPELSGLVLSLVDKTGHATPGFLTLQDIYNMRLSADLVVLSGCETALGQQIDGEGLIGLTRGFMSAGAPRVIASLWKVSDEATATLMSDFYSSMQKGGLSPAAALRAAQIAMWKRKQWSAPYYWAAFTLQGDWK